jgi:dynein light intermediate chain 1, cytosolic
LGVWILDGDKICSTPLLKFALKAETLENTVLMLVVSMTQPWSLLTTLNKWITLVEEHIDRFKLDPTRLRELRDRLQNEFQHYIEPTDTSSSNASGKLTTRVSNSTSSMNIPINAGQTDDQVVLPLAEGVLNRSLGIPMIVVVTKVFSARFIFLIDPSFS